MDFILQQGYDIKDGKLREFQTWLAGSEQAIRDACPDGVDYVGTYAAVHSSEKHTGGIHTLWRLDSYGAQDAMAAAAGGPGAFADLSIEWQAFIDDNRAANWSQNLLKAVTDATIFE